MWFPKVDLLLLYENTKTNLKSSKIESLSIRVKTNDSEEVRRGEGVWERIREGSGPAC